MIASARQTEHPVGLGAARTMDESPASLSLERVYAEHAAFVWRTVRRLGVPQAAVEDAVQDVFVVVHRRLAEFEGRSALRTWLFAIVRRVVRDHRPSKRQHPVDTAALDALPGHDAGPLALAERAQAARLLLALLDELDEEKREAFILVDLEEMSVPDAAEALSANANTVYSRVRAARRELEQALGRVRARLQRSEPWNA